MIWDPSIGYVEGAVVIYNDNAWLALINNKESAPSISNPSWELVLEGGGGSGSVFLEIGTSPFPPTGLIRFGTGAAPGNFTVANSGLVWFDSLGNEQLRLWATNPDLNANANVGNLFLGALAGENQPSDDTTAGSVNTGIGNFALQEVVTGIGNTALGALALNKQTGNFNTGVGVSALRDSTTGASNTAIGNSAGMGDFSANQIVTTDQQLTLIGYAASKNTASIIQNSTALGNGAQITASNQVVLGGPDVTAVETVGVLHAFGYKSSDGTAGATAGPFSVVTSITVKNGLVTAITGTP